MEWIPDIATDNTSKLNVRWNAIQKGLLFDFFSNFAKMLKYRDFNFSLGPTKNQKMG